MGYAVDPYGPARNTALLASITALEAAVIVILGRVALLGADSVEEAHVTLAELRAHCEQVRETLLSMAVPRAEAEAVIFSTTFTRELDHIFGAIRFRAATSQ